MFWSQSYCLISTGGVTVDIIKEYIQTQGRVKYMSKANKSNKAIKYRLYQMMNKKSCLQKLLVAVVLFITNYSALQKQRYKDGESHLSKLKSNEFALLVH